MVRERQGRTAEAVALHQQVSALRPLTAAELVRLGELAMSAQQTATAIEAFEKARALEGDRFRHDLELGVLYLSARDLDEARAALDRVPASHPEYPMALVQARAGERAAATSRTAPRGSRRAQAAARTRRRVR